jgi:hypothetical protein
VTWARFRFACSPHTFVAGFRHLPPSVSADDGALRWNHGAVGILLSIHALCAPLSSSKISVHLMFCQLCVIKNNHGCYIDDIARLFSRFANDA